MTALESQLGKYNVTVRLFNFINDLSTDEQFKLYKQLINDNVTSRLFKLIIDMSVEEKKQFLEQLAKVPYLEEPIKTINLDENESFMREKPRKICLVSVKCKVGAHSFKNYIINISSVGAFIETNDRFQIDQNIQMMFKLPNHPKTLELEGRITRSGFNGIGVKFLGLNQNQQEIIKAYIANK